jgi:type I restriction enzyme M protein
MSAIVQKPWNYCNVLRDDLSASEHVQADGMSYGDYPSAWLEQLTYLLFLKMAEGGPQMIVPSEFCIA